MRGDWLYRCCYKALKFIHWSFFSVVVTLFFWVAGGTLGGMVASFMVPTDQSISGAAFKVGKDIDVGIPSPTGSDFSPSGMKGSAPAAAHDDHQGNASDDGLTEDAPPDTEALLFADAGPGSRLVSNATRIGQGCGLIAGIAFTGFMLGVGRRKR
jgi:hypothetical protein